MDTKLLEDLGIEICGTQGTVEGIPGACTIPKIGRGSPDVLDVIRSKKISLIVNTPRKGWSSNTDGFKIRRAAIEQGIPCLTNMNTAFEFLKAMKELKGKELEVRTVEEWSSAFMYNEGQPEKTPNDWSSTRIQGTRSHKKTLEYDL